MFHHDGNIFQAQGIVLPCGVAYRGLETFLAEQFLPKDADARARIFKDAFLHHEGRPCVEEILHIGQAFNGRRPLEQVEKTHGDLIILAVWQASLTGMAHSMPVRTAQ
jgi:hypothetical protein